MTANNHPEHATPASISCPPIIDSVDEATPEWLSDALGATVTAVSHEPVGSGQIGSCFRLVLTGDDVPASVLLKLPTPDEGTRSILVGAYRIERRFYLDLKPDLHVSTPQCFAASEVDDSGRFALLLQDMSPATQGDQIAGCTPAQVTDAAVNLAGLHAPFWGDPALLSLGWIRPGNQDDATLLGDLFEPTTDAYRDQVGDLLDDETEAVLRACTPVIGDWLLARPECFSLLHGDYRLDNLLFPTDGGPGVSAVDWQTMSVGLPARDLAYLVSTSLEPEERRTYERSIVAAYHQALVTGGVDDYDLEACWEDYRFSMIQGPLVALFGCAYGAPSERGNQMFAAMIRRSCKAIKDLDTLALAGASAQD